MSTYGHLTSQVADLHLRLSALRNAGHGAKRRHGEDGPILRHEAFQAAWAGGGHWWAGGKGLKENWCVSWTNMRHGQIKPRCWRKRRITCRSPLAGPMWSTYKAFLSWRGAARASSPTRLGAPNALPKRPLPKGRSQAPSAICPQHQVHVCGCTSAHTSCTSLILKGSKCSVAAQLEVFSATSFSKERQAAFRGGPSW